MEAQLSFSEVEDREMGKCPSSGLPLFSFFVLLFVDLIDLHLLIIVGWAGSCPQKHSTSRNSFSSAEQPHTAHCSKGMWEMGLALVINVFIFSA